MKKIAGLLFLVFVFLYGCGNGSGNPAPEGTLSAAGNEEGSATGEIIAQVGDERITQADIDQILTQIPAQYRARYATAEGRRELVDALVSMKMLAWEARRRGVDKRPDVRLKLDYLTEQTLARELEEELRGTVKVEEADIERYYREHQDTYVTPGRVKARHILVDSEEEAGTILKKLQQGADFAGLAKEKSKCPSAEKGGDLGWFEPGKMDPAFEKAAFALKKGETSGVVKSSFGYHIIKVENTKPAKTKTLDQARKSIERTMSRELLEQQVARLRETIRGEIPVVVNEAYFTTLEKEKGSSGTGSQDRPKAENTQGD